MEWPKITADTPLEEVKGIHHDIWQYAVENGKKPNTPYEYNCIACEYSRLEDYLDYFFSICDNFFSICDNCPIDWESLGIVDGYVQSSLGCTQYRSICKLWLTSDDPDHKRHLAELIRDVKWKFEKEGSDHV